nr:MAG TPA: hypothetical protein [Caudoviricetes sp.]
MSHGPTVAEKPCAPTVLSWDRHFHSVPQPHMHDA